MSVQPIPEGYHAVTPYLLVADARRLLAFLKDALGAVESHMSSRPDGTIMHGDVRIGDSHVMLADAMEGWPARPGAIYLYVQDVDAVYAKAIAAGATSTMPPTDQFYGDRTAFVTDPTGNQWFIATRVEDVPPDELDRRRDALGK